LLEKVVADCPDVPDYRGSQGLAVGNLADLLADAGRTDEAERVYRRSLEIWKALAADPPGVIAHQVVPAVRIRGMRGSAQPAVRPLTRRLACFVPSLAIRFIASRRSSARFSAALSSRARPWSSWNTTSRTQCCEFSIPQWPRTAFANRLAFGFRLLMK